MKKRIISVLAVIIIMFLLGYSLAEEKEIISVGVLKGPTGMGIAKCMADSEGSYSFSVYDAPDAIVGKFINKEIDIAAVPINLAATLYNKLQGDVGVIAVNTLGVLHILENGNDIHSVEDLGGKTVYATGEGSTPQYILEQMLNEYGINEAVTTEYYGEHALLASAVAAGKVSIAMLPEPNVSAVLLKNNDVRIALNMTEEWEKITGKPLVQGCYIARQSFINENREAVKKFLQNAEESANYVNHDQNGAQTTVDMGIIPSVEIAKKAIPNSNIVLITGSEMKDTCRSMLECLYHANKTSVGGNIPADDFYIILDEETVN